MLSFAVYVIKHLLQFFGCRRWCCCSKNNFLQTSRSSGSELFIDRLLSIGEFWGIYEVYTIFWCVLLCCEIPWTEIKLMLKLQIARQCCQSGLNGLLCRVRVTVSAATCDRRTSSREMIRICRSCFLRLVQSVLLLFLLLFSHPTFADQANVFIYHRFNDSRYPTTIIRIAAFRVHLDYILAHNLKAYINLLNKCYLILSSFLFFSLEKFIENSWKMWFHF